MTPEFLLRRPKFRLKGMTWRKHCPGSTGTTRSPSRSGHPLRHPVILVSFGFVFVQAIRRKVPWRVALPFAINLVANLSFTPIQFGMRNLVLAAVDILIVWVTIIWMSMSIWKHYRWVSVAQVPYFVWVSLATVLQLSITAMNWGRP
jgi:benzodiazapine receptor